jgi:hypothetical protein
MIRILLEEWPHGDRRNARCLRELIVINDQTGTELEGNYVAAISGNDGFAEPIPTLHLPPDALKTTRIFGHDRRTGIMPLVRKALEVLS